jgi:hypothetical protein
MSTIILLFVSLIYGCKKHDLTKITGITFDQNLAVPIGYGEFGIHDLLKSTDSLIKIDASTHEMSLFYRKELDTIFASDVIKLRDTSVIFKVAPPNLIPHIINSFNGVINDPIPSQVFSYATQNGVLLHDLNFESGLLKLDVSSTFKHDITLKITFPDLKLSGNIVSKTINLTYSNSIPQTGSGTIDLSNVLADFTANKTADNTLRIEIDAKVTGKGNPITGSENLDLKMNLINLKFKNITGYFGQQNLAKFTDSLLLKIFEKPIDGSLSFTNPKLKFIVDNSFGIPIRLNFNKLESVDKLTNQSSTIDYSNTKDIASPASIGSQSVSTIISLNNSTTNNTMTNLVDASPKYLKYDISAQLNPLGNVGPLNFIESTSRMIVNADLELPIEGYASGMTAKDTMDFSLDQNIKNIKSVLFRLKVDNGLPLSLIGQAEFVDKNYKHLFNLFDKNTQIISAAPVNSDGIVKSQISKSTDIVITENKTLLLDQVKYIIISGITETTQPSKTVVKLQDTNKIGIKLSVQVQLKGK